MTADVRALLWLVGGVAMLVGAFLLTWPVVLIAAGYLVTNWSRR